MNCFTLGWRYFDDDNVLKIEDERVVDSSAYVLVYRMRSTAQALKLESPFVISPVQVIQFNSIQFNSIHFRLIH